jgi:hypothetical protein|tara:strand:- start:160 stop:297 length:138 start_codon:yes stop_codon:yes gene_type:complete
MRLLQACLMIVLGLVIQVDLPDGESWIYATGIFWATIALIFSLTT